ncbi:MAG: acyl-CoA dehydrogenase family protein [Candidatus Lernaella stagnicola]|nr:acyl-CoA dehydrogenase family protein [Candidatus Lernaella stagnicola]
MANFYDDNHDLRFYVDHAIDWAPLVELTEYQWTAADGFRNVDDALEFYRGVLDLVGNFVAEEVAPLSAELDHGHPVLEDGVVRFPPLFQQLFDNIRALELHGMALPRELGGMNTPFLLFMICTELFARGDVSVSTHQGFHGGMAMAMLLYSIMEGTTEFDTEAGMISKTRFADAITEIISGEAWGSMDITEPGAGSDMAALRTKGEQDEDGNWLVTGEKIFITSGHAKYHFVIARTEKAADPNDAFAGLKGLSMFLVPAFEIDADGKRRHYASFEKLEEKLGHHASATVTINFDRSPALLIGERGDGFRLMLQLMNNARVGVGFECIGVCETAYRMAAAYAAERPSMGKNIARHEMIADYLDEMRTDIQGLRALAVNGAYHEEMAKKLDLILRFRPPADEAEKKDTARQHRHHVSSARRLTPLVKYLAAEKAVEMARRCIQIHGGYGYSTEFGAEKLLRDALVMPIYEGTSQIQALMAMKDSLMGVLKNPRRFLEGMARTKLRARTASDRDAKRVARLQALQYSALQFLLSRLAGKKIAGLRRQPISQWKTFFGEWDPKTDFALAMLHAERLTRILADVAVCELLLEQAERFPERREVLERYLERAEPRCKFLHEEITTTGARLLAHLEETEADENAAT